MGPLVTTDWLAGELGKPGLVVFDATKYLPNEPKDGHAEFLAAHIPGARYFDIDAIADTDTDLPHMVPTPGRFGKLMSQLGVGNDSRVVFYDQKGLASAARGWWLMGLFGHDNAAVLDGGLPKWVKQGRATQSGESPAPTPTDLPTRLPGSEAARRWRRAAQRRYVHGTGTRRARRGPLHRRHAGTSRRHAQRAYPRLGQRSLYRAAERGRHIPSRSKRCALGSRRPASMRTAGR